MKLETIAERLNSNDRAVSPVIGVILMVAITVILAAVIGTFVLDLGQSAGNNAPSASLTVSADTDSASFEVSHKGGDTLNSGQTTFKVVNESSDETLTWSATGSETLSVGDTANVSVDDAAPYGWVNFSGTGTYDVADRSGAWTTYEVVSGHQYTVQVIDTESQRVIFETTVTA